ncbi:hypothetical protein LIA77_00425 [Sarocladium implicatum]|nr:hypothetical protein LIA77_00425 [Sarocladium implicatum]
MTNLPSQHPTLSLHLTDHTLHPLITSSSSPSHLNSLTDLTSSALISQTAVQRAGLGRPQRIMVEYPDRGPVVLQSYLDPPGTDAQPKKTLEDDETSVAGSKPQGEEPAPTLIGVVVAGSADEAREARRAAGRLERVGREFQREWMSETTVAADRDSSLATTE